MVKNGWAVVKNWLASLTDAGATVIVGVVAFAGGVLTALVGGLVTGVFGLALAYLQHDLTLRQEAEKSLYAAQRNEYLRTIIAAEQIVGFYRSPIDHNAPSRRYAYDQERPRIQEAFQRLDQQMIAARLAYGDDPLFSRLRANLKACHQALSVIRPGPPPVVQDYRAVPPTQAERAPTDGDYIRARDTCDAGRSEIEAELKRFEARFDEHILQGRSMPRPQPGRP